MKKEQEKYPEYTETLRNTTYLRPDGTMHRNAEGSHRSPLLRRVGKLLGACVRGPRLAPDAVKCVQTRGGAGETNGGKCAELLQVSVDPTDPFPTHER